MNSKQRENMLRRRFQHQLELQSTQIERVFDRHQVDAHVSGGHVQAGGVRFELQAQLSNGMERLLGLTQELRAALGVRQVRLGGEGGRLSVQVTAPEAPPVPLLALIGALPDELPPATAVLGLSEADQPVLVQFEGPDAGHVLIAGEADAGKTTLLRTLALSLALGNRQSRLQLVVMQSDPRQGDGDLRPLDYLPHMLATVTHGAAEAREMLSFLADEVAYRREQRASTPVIVVMLDGATTLLDNGGNEFRRALVKLLQQGAETGVYLVLSSSRPAAAVWGQLLPAYVPLRIVGRVAEAATAQAAAGVPATQAEYLLGQGDFLAVSGETWMRFQAAAVTNSDLHLSLQELHRKRPRALLARPVTSRVQLQPEMDPARAPQTPIAFTFDGESVALESTAPELESAPEPRARRPYEPVVAREENADAADEAVVIEEAAPEEAAPEEAAPEEAAPEEASAPEPRVRRPYERVVARKKKGDAVDEAVVIEEAAPEPRARRPYEPVVARKENADAADEAVVIEEAAPEVESAPEPRARRPYERVVARKKKGDAADEAVAIEEAAPEPRARRPYERVIARKKKGDAANAFAGDVGELSVDEPEDEQDDWIDLEV